MPQKTWSAKRERQYEHIKQGILKKGSSEERAEEIAARTVNKIRVQEGEAKQASPTSITDLPPARRGGLLSHRGAAGRTYTQLYAEARKKGLKGRSAMNKQMLQAALNGR